MLGQVGCASEYPKIFVGDVGGTTFYDGAALAGTANPVLLVGAYAYDVGFLDRIVAGEKPIPHAVFYAPNPVFAAQGIPYRLSNLDPYDQGYFVTAVILDMMDAAATPTAAGLFPDMSILTSQPDKGPVQVVADRTLTNVDIRLQDVSMP
jgi:hypothetical protein